LSSGNVQLFATQASATVAASSNYATQLYTLTDSTGAGGQTWTSLVNLNDGSANAASNVTQFRGVAVVPKAVGATAADMAIQSNANPSTVGQNVTFTATVTDHGTSAPIANQYVSIRDGSTTLFTGY